MTAATPRPDLRDYFRACIDEYVNGWSARTVARLPRDVVRVEGDVTDPVIVAIMRDGSRHEWRGGRYAARKSNGCHAPLMPTGPGQS